MPSVADSILAAVKALLDTEFAAEKLTCHTSRASEFNPAFFVGMRLPCFVASLNGDRPTRPCTARTKFVTYSVLVEHLSVEVPGDRKPSGTIEDVLKRVSALFMRPGLAGVPAVSDCTPRPRGPYQKPFSAKTVNAAAVVLTVEAIEPVN